MSHPIIRIPLYGFVLSSLVLSAESPAAADEESVYDLDPVEVKGNAFSRPAQNLQDSVVYDPINGFGGNNVADSLNQLSGVSVEFDGGDARFVIIRGIDPALNNITVNGISVASTSPESRAAQLDGFEIEGFERIILNKVLMPDQSADSIGGLIEFVSPSAFDLGRRQAAVTATGFYHDLTDELGGKTSFRFGDIFENGKVGVFLTGSSSDRATGTDLLSVDPFEAVAGNLAPGGAVEFVELDIDRERSGTSLNVEYKPTKRSSFFARANFNVFNDEVYRQRSTLDFGDAIGDGAVATTNSTITATNEIKLVQDIRRKVIETRNLISSFGGEHEIRLLKVDYALGYAHAEEDEDQFELAYELDDEPSALTLVGTDQRTPRLGTVVGGGLTNPSAYEFDEAASEIIASEETNWSGELNLTRSFGKGFWESVQTGAHVQIKDKDSEVEVFAWEDEPSRFENLTFSSQRRDFLDTGIPGIPISLLDSIERSPNEFNLNRDLGESLASDFRSSENIYATYAMARFRFEQFKFTAGVRVEHTEFRSNSRNFPSGAPISSEKDYTHVLPGLHMLYRSKDTIDSVDAWTVRASWTNTIARPGFEETKAGVFVEDEEVEFGNPDLDPLESMNFDVSVKYEHVDWGTFSVGGFYKDIHNFIYAQRREANFDSDPDLEELKNFLNGPSGSLLGAELAFERRLNFLPGALNALYFSSSATFIDSEASVLGTNVGDPNRDLSFLKQSDFIGKVAFTWTYRDFFAQVAYNYRSAYLDEVGEAGIDDFYVDERYQLDLSMSYLFKEHWMFFGRIDNLTEEPLKAYWGSTGRIAEYEDFGMSASFGVKWIY